MPNRHFDSASLLQRQRVLPKPSDTKRPSRGDPVAEASVLIRSIQVPLNLKYAFGFQDDQTRMSSPPYVLPCSIKSARLTASLLSSFHITFPRSSSQYKQKTHIHTLTLPYSHIHTLPLYIHYAHRSDLPARCCLSGLICYGKTGTRRHGLPCKGVSYGQTYKSDSINVY